jgi:hypothetical protein
VIDQKIMKWKERYVFDIASCARFRNTPKRPQTLADSLPSLKFTATRHIENRVLISRALAVPKPPVYKRESPALGTYSRERSRELTLRPVKSKSLRLIIVIIVGIEMRSPCSSNRSGHEETTKFMITFKYSSIQNGFQFSKAIKGR